MKKQVWTEFLGKEWVKWVVILFVVASFSFDGYQFQVLRMRNLAMQSELDQFQSALQISQKRLQGLQMENQSVNDALTTETQNSDLFAGQIQNLTSTVGVLEKLSQTDSQLLEKYSKVYFLNENYVPKNLIDIDPKYLYEKNKEVQIQAQVWPHLQKLLDDASSQGVNILIASGYRSFAAQAALKTSYKMTYGSGANKFSADQGYSEHQLGTTVDFTTQAIGGGLTGFDKTDAYKWLLDNAYKYGFIMSYPKENKYYIFEPWHFRFVSILLATRLHSDNNYFYALDQRDISQYLLNFFD